ncbi:MAG: cytochrome C [Ectothiorhodospiraceae bacterium]|nr:cytochrome C [Ectothiorhodospiraceae bacterium]
MASIARVSCLSIAISLVVSAASAQPSALPDGAGRAVLERHCVACHDLRRPAQALGFDAAGWRELVDTMVDLGGSPDLEVLTEYLAEHFPPRADGGARVVDGPVRIRFREWRVPTRGQRARDPVEAPDGGIWWAGQWGNLLGRIDPATDSMREYPLPTGARPHTVTTDAAGNVWYTGNGNGTIGRLDPATGAVTEYPMPDPALRDPHSMIADARGVLWFTAQNSNMVGRLDPVSGEIRVREVPTPGSRPYGIKLDSRGTPFVACNGGNCLLRIDPATMEIREYRLPDAGSTVRRLAFASDDTIWYVNSRLGRIGHLDPRTGEVREWPSPSGPRSHPYAIAVVDDIVWYNESGVRPDMLVRFDPATEVFQSWPIPSGSIHAGIVRHMRPTRAGDLLVHQSATNRVLLVDLP